MSRLTLAACLFASLAHAEPAWLTSQGRVSSQTEVAIFAGPRSLGVGLLLPRGSERRGFGLEGAWLFQDRVAEVRTALRWQLNATSAATWSATAGLTGFVVPEGQFALGLGPHVGLHLSLGGRVAALELGLLSGFDLFTDGVARFTERLQLGLRSVFGRFTLGLSGRAGVDLSPGRNFVLRADAIFSVGLRSAP